ncbi:MAG: DUF255 domain-containing protein [Elusimicrobiota bacterium]|jgi:hypothetical protein
MVWNEWDRRAFERAERERKPVFLHLASSTSRLSATVDAVYDRPQVASLIASRFVPVRVRAEDRPDLARRFGTPDASPVVLDHSGEAVSTLSFFSPEDLAEALGRAADACARPAGVPTKASPRPAPLSELDPARPAAVLAGLKFERADAFPCAESLELLLYAAREWKSPEVAETLKFQLARLVRSDVWDQKDRLFCRPDEVARVDVNAVLCRIFLDASAVTGEASLRETGLSMAAALLKGFYDDRSGAFRLVPETSSRVFYADANAMAAICMLRAAALGKGGEWREAADRSLVFLINMVDMEKGVAHRWDGRAAIHGLLGDNAWAVLALTESFLSRGNKPHRELADAILKILFQQFWEGERGGFLDRAPVDDDAPALKVPVMPGALNAVALEGAWRLNHLKGNVHYGRWTAAALKSVIPAVEPEPCASAALSRVQDMLSRGRMDLELVGRIGDAATEEMISAVNSHYLPRKIISFVDPDDQDFILPHKLKTQTWPKLFGCIDLRPKFEASRPGEVDALLEAIS